MNETAERVAEKGADTFLAAISHMDPGVQLSLLTLTAITALSLAAIVAVVIYFVRFSNAVTEKMLTEIRNNSDSAVMNTEAIKAVGDVVRGLDNTVQANTLELARSRAGGG